MKKILVAVLTVVLALSLCLVACNPDEEGPNGTDKVTITVLDRLELKVGETPDFNGHVKVVVNDVEVTNPTVTCTLLNGDPTVAGPCTYRVIYKHNDKEYSKNGFVDFYTDSVVLTANNFSATVGDTIDWKAHVTVTVNGAVQNNPTLNVTVKSGTEGVAGDVVYTVKYNFNGDDYTKDVTVTYTDVDPDDTDIIETLFQKEYDSYTCDYKYYTVGYESEPYHEVAKVVLDKISTIEVNWDQVYNSTLSSGHYYWYLDVTNDLVREYQLYDTDTAQLWKYVNYSLDNDGADYSVPYAFAQPYDSATAINKLYFTRTGDTTYEVKSAYLQELAEVLFFYDYIYETDGDKTTFTQIVVTVDDDSIVSIKGSFEHYYSDYDDSANEVVEYSWSNLDGTTVTLPADAVEYVPELEVPEYIAPEQAQNLTSDQTTAVTAALAKADYTSITYLYKNTYSFYVDEYSGKLTSTASYDVEHSYLQYQDMVMDMSLDKALFVPTSATKGNYYVFYNDQNDYYCQELDGTIALASGYIPFTAFGFTADEFGATADGTYLVKPVALAAVQSKVSAVFGLDDFYSATLMSFTFKLDAFNNVTEWSFLVDVTLKNNDGTAGKQMYMQMFGNYSAFNATTIEIPGVFNTTEITDANAVNAALKEDYSNVTVAEHGNNSMMYFVGNDVRVDGYNYDDQGNAISTWSRLYKIEGSNYSEIIGGMPQECTEVDFLYNVLRFDFTLLENHLKYNAATDTYICHVADFAGYDNDAFAYYWSGFWGGTQQITDIELTIKDGHVVGVRMYVTITQTTTDETTGATTTTTMYNTMSATLSAFGTTEIPSDTETAE